jgi:hypothetical protein
MTMKSRNTRTDNEKLSKIPTGTLLRSSMTPEEHSQFIQRTRLGFPGLIEQCEEKRGAKFT